MEIFEAIAKFLASVVNYLNFNEIFMIFVGLFLVAVLIVIFSTSESYEAKLIKVIDMFNNYFIDNPNITEENLVPFNQRMKSKKVPKQLRKQWQQFVLYREHKASYYMSFENCVSNPIKNSSFKRDLTILNIISYVFAVITLVLNVYHSYNANDFTTLLQNVLLTPAIILLINYLVTIFLDVRHNAIVSDLFQNYQYFEANIDKATMSLPEYVDYEVLFDRAEIKKGIPILYAYLQKRAEEEQRELEMARLKNVEHEQFNFDEAGVAGSLVLERAMQEAENYIAERKKYNQDTEQINADITQEEMNYREITKEYNRQMQVSRETFENFKAQLNEVSSTIEANYLKKQQQQELDRQRNLERDFDTHTERHKKVLESYQAELDSVDEFRNQSRKSLEDAMMSEFKSYSAKVYEEAKKVAEQRQSEKFNKVKQQLKALEETLAMQNKELDNVYAQNQALSERLGEHGISTDVGDVVQPIMYEVPQADGEEELFNSNTNETFDDPQYYQEGNGYQPVQESYYSENGYQEQEQDQSFNNQQDVENVSNQVWDEENQNDYPQNEMNRQETDGEEESGEGSGSDEMPMELEDPELKNHIDPSDEEENQSEDEENDYETEVSNANENIDDFDLDEDQDSYDSTEEEEESEVEDEGEYVEQPKKRPGRPRKIVDENEEKKPKKGPGRPRKEKVVDNTPKKKPGRPRKVVDNEVEEQPKRRAGRPRKEVVETKNTARKVGRPKKTSTDEVKTEPKKKAGRPKKVATDEVVIKTSKGRGRPRKTDIETNTQKRSVGRPKKSSSSVDIDAYLKEINDAIAQENAKIKKTRAQLEQKATLSKRKK